ncbi:MAG TPA: hypothetical protein VHJ79_13020, partial [Mycobacterium sp.]|nr:hypothetical protein [Mycobacterium sp.]
MDVRLGRRDRRQGQKDKTETSANYSDEPPHGTGSLTLASESAPIVFNQRMLSLEEISDRFEIQQLLID